MRDEAIGLERRQRIMIEAFFFFFGLLHGFIKYAESQIGMEMINGFHDVVFRKNSPEKWKKLPIVNVDLFLGCD